MSVRWINGPRSRQPPAPITHNSKPAIFHIADTIMGHIKVREVKNHDHETRIQQAIKERTKKRTTLRDLAILYEIPHSILSDRLRGMPSRHEAQQKCQAISSAVERSLIRWADDMDASGFHLASIYSKLQLADWYLRRSGLHLVPHD